MCFLAIVAFFLDIDFYFQKQWILLLLFCICICICICFVLFLFCLGSKGIPRNCNGTNMKQNNKKKSLSLLLSRIGTLEFKSQMQNYMRKTRQYTNKTWQQQQQKEWKCWNIFLEPRWIFSRSIFQHAQQLLNFDLTLTIFQLINKTMTKVNCINMSTIYLSSRFNNFRLLFVKLFIHS